MSIRQGQKDDKGVARIIGNALVANVVASIVFMTLCYIFMDPLLGLFGASEASLPLAKAYFSIILTATIASTMGNVLANIVRADGSPKFSMLVTVVGALINTILDPIFIFALDMGIEGAAIATILAQIISFGLGCYYVFFKARTFKLKLSSFNFNWKIFWQFTKLGVSTFITQMSIVVTALVTNMMLAKYGAESVYGSDIPIASMGITMKVLSIMLSIAIGLAVGAQPILGYNYGARNYDRVKQAFRIIISMTVVVGLVATVIFQLFPDLMINIFGASDGLYMEFARMLFRIFLMAIVLTLSAKVISIFFQAIGEPVRSVASSLTRDLVCFVPLCLILPGTMGVEGVLWAAPIADVFGIAVAGTLAVKFYRRLGADDVVEMKMTDTITDSKPGVIITIAREHGSAGKEIGRLVAKELGVPYYYKEVLAIAAKESGMSEEYLDQINQRSEEGAMRELYLSSAPAEYAIKAQRQAITEIAKHGSCVIIGRAADYVLRKNKHVFRVFISAPEEYKIKKIKEMYGDDKSAAKKSMRRSDRNRASYYNTVSGLEWGKRENYDLCVDSSIGNEATAKIIVNYAKSKK